MSLIQCQECDHEVSKTAKQCPSCGAKNKQKASWGQIAFLVVGGMVLFSILSEPSPNYNNSTAVKTNADAVIAKSSPKNTAAILEATSWSCDQEHGYMFIRGEVKNVSDRPIKRG